MFETGRQFDEETEHNTARYVIARVEGDKVFAKKLSKHDQPEQEFSKEELMSGNTFASYWFIGAK